MRTATIFSGVVLLAGATCFGADEKQKEKPCADASIRSSVEFRR